MRIKLSGSKNTKKKRIRIKNAHIHSKIARTTFIYEKGDKHRQPKYLREVS